MVPFVVSRSITPVIDKDPSVTGLYNYYGTMNCKNWLAFCPHIQVRKADFGDGIVLSLSGQVLSKKVVEQWGQFDII